MRVPLYGRDRVCRDCFLGREVKAIADVVATPANVPTPKRNLNYKTMTQAELFEFVADCKAKSAAATTKAESNRWSHKARRARALLPPQECALPGCHVLCEDGNEYCGKSHSGKAAKGSVLRFVQVKRVTDYSGSQDFYNETPHPIHNEIDALFSLPVWQTPLYNPMEARVTG